MGKVMKEVKIRIILMIRNKNWYEIHVLTQGVSDGFAKDH